MTVALFVEGASDIPLRNGLTPLQLLWANTYLPALTTSHDFLVVPISKKTIVALDPAAPKMSGAAEAFDQLFMRTLRGSDFDRALVLWDMVPAWNPSANLCRREEILSFFRFMASSTVLGLQWKQSCAAKLDRLVSRTNGPSQSLAAGQIGITIMDPMFEDLLVHDEGSTKLALNVARGRAVPKGWPRNGWGGSSMRPDSLVLAPAISAARKSSPKGSIFRSIRGDFRTAKNEWAEYLLRHQLAQDDAVILNHPISVRLSALL
jgi:hypothetical protein